MITTTTTTNYFDPNTGIMVELPCEPVDKEVYVSEDGNTLTFLVHDDSCWDYDWPEGVTFCQPTNKTDYDEFMQSFADTCDIYPVGKYEHGLVHFSVADTRQYPDMNFDYCLGGYIAIPTDFTDTLESANAILDEYSSWCNGEVYGIISVNVNDPDDFDSCFGFIGYGYAVDTAKAGGF